MGVEGFSWSTKSSIEELASWLERAKAKALAYAFTPRGKGVTGLKSELGRLAILESVVEARLKEAKTGEEKAELEKLLREIREVRRSIAFLLLAEGVF